MNWLVGQGLTGLPEPDLIRGFCERCRDGGLPLSRGLVFIDTLHPIYEGRGFRWTDRETNESDTFEYGSSSEGDAAKNWRRSAFHHMLENGHDELAIDLADAASLDFSMIGELAALRDLVPVLALAIKSAQQVDIARTLGRVYLGRDASAQVLGGRITPKIDPPQGSRDIDLLRGFDRQSQDRHEIAQRHKFGFRKSS